MAREAPVLMFGEQRVVVTPRDDPEQLLMALAELWVEATGIGSVLRHIEEKIVAQDTWLDANRAHPLWSERANRAWEVRKEHERTLYEIHVRASAANRLVEKMDESAKREAQVNIHAWAGIGGPGVYAIAWDIVPNRVWLEDAVSEGQRLRETVEVPF